MDISPLQYKFSNEDFVRVLIHIAQRRGFKSNRKGEAKDQEAGKLLKSVEANKLAMDEKGYRTVGEMFYKDEKYKNPQYQTIPSPHASTLLTRNKSGEYLNTVSRSLVLDEVQQIFASQRNMGNPFASREIEEKYTGILSAQRSFDEGPGGDSPYAGNLIERMLGNCTFEKDEKRAPKASYSFELFNLRQKVNHIRLQGDGDAKALTREQRSIIIEEAHKSPTLTFKKIRSLLDLPLSLRFNTVRYDYRKITDAEILEQEAKTKFEFLKAYHEMRKVLDKVSKDRIHALFISDRDEIARIFSLYKNEDKIKAALAESNLTELDKSALINGLGSFSKFGHLSIKALNNILPHLEDGLTYDKACVTAGYDFKAEHDGQKTYLLSLRFLAEEMEHSITSPVSRRAISQCAKVINAIIREMGNVPPVYINVELAREMSQTYEDRGKAEKSMLENQAKNEKAKEQIKEYGKFSPTGLDIVKLKLWNEQKGECPYSGKSLQIERLFEVGYTDIDHIIPYSKCFNDGYNNKVLVLSAENRQKGDRLPLEYLTGKRRDDFIIWANTSHLPYAKKLALLKETITPEDKAGFTERNRNDTRTISRFIFNHLRDYLQLSPSNTGKKQITAVNGAVTSYVRKRLGIIKIREDGDTHHAIDAAVIACITDGMIQDVTQYSKSKENRYTQMMEQFTKEHFPHPYPDFVPDLEGNLKKVFVSRAPNRKITGAAHKETIKSVDTSGSLIKKVALTNLKLDANGEIPNYYRPNDDRLLYEAIKQRLQVHGNDPKKAFVEPLHKPKSDGTPGPIVKGVKVSEKSTLNVAVHKGKGRADNDSIVRTDVFYVEGKGGGYYLVPIYVADTLKRELPNRAIVANKPYEKWEIMDGGDFLFSLYPNDLIWVKHKKLLPLNLNKHNKSGTLPATLEVPETFLYYKGVDISVGKIITINHDNSYSFRGGAKTLAALEKWQVDALGNISKVSREPRLGFFRSKKR